jgi:hypothetical protein
MKKKNNHGLSAEQKAFVRNVLRDPVLFARHILGVSLWEREVEIVQSIQTQRRTAVKACHGVGKTFTLAVGTLWWLARYPEGIVLTTSPTQRQVRTQLWSEIHRLVERAKVPYPNLNTTRLDFRDHNNFALGFSTNQAENFQGYHGKQVLIIADEAPGIEPEIWDAVAGVMAADYGIVSPSMLSIHPTSKGSRSSNCCAWTRPKAVRSIAIPFRTWLPNVGSTTSTWPGGTAATAARRTGCPACWPAFRIKLRTRSSK